MLTLNLNFYLLLADAAASWKSVVPDCQVIDWAAWGEDWMAVRQWNSAGRQRLSCPQVRTTSNQILQVVESNSFALNTDWCKFHAYTSRSLHESGWAFINLLGLDYELYKQLKKLEFLSRHAGPTIRSRTGGMECWRMGRGKRGKHRRATYLQNPPGPTSHESLLMLIRGLQFLMTPNPELQIQVYTPALATTIQLHLWQTKDCNPTLHCCCCYLQCDSPTLLAEVKVRLHSSTNLVTAS